MTNRRRSRRRSGTGGAAGRGEARRRVAAAAGARGLAVACGGGRARRTAAAPSAFGSSALRGLLGVGAGLLGLARAARAPRRLLVPELLLGRPRRLRRLCRRRWRRRLLLLLCLLARLLRARFSSRSRRRCSRSRAAGSSGRRRDRLGASRRSSPSVSSPPRRAAGQVGLEQVRGGERVARGAGAAAAAGVGHPGGEALVVGLDRDRRAALPVRAQKVRASAAWLPSSPLRWSGRPTTTRSTSCSRPARRPRAAPAVRSPAAACQGAGRVGDRAADPAGAVVEGEHAHRRSAQLPLDRRARGGQRLVELRRVLAAGLRHVVAAAAAAADDRRGLADRVRRREAPLDRVLARRARPAPTLPPLAAAEHDRRRRRASTGSGWRRRAAASGSASSRRPRRSR